MMLFTNGVTEPGKAPTGLGKRDEHLEGEFLRGAERLAGMDNGWAHFVAERLAAAEREKGVESYMRLTLRQIAAEIGEEGLDVGGWAAVGFLLSYRDLADDDEKGYLVRCQIQRIASYGPLIAEEVRKLQDLLAE